MVHGDAAARNLIIPSSQPRNPVWIDLSCMSRSIESDFIWDTRKAFDEVEFSYAVSHDTMQCDSCEGEFNAWCLAHRVPGHRDRDEPDSVTDATVAALREAEEREEDFHCAYVSAAEESRSFSLEPNTPTRGLLPRKNALGAYDIGDPWLVVGGHPEFSTMPIPDRYAATRAE